MCYVINRLLELCCTVCPGALQVPEVHADMQSHSGGSHQTLEAKIARAKTLERAGQWSGAIDAYLAITIQDTSDVDFLEGVSFCAACRACFMLQPSSIVFLCRH